MLRMARQAVSRRPSLSTRALNSAPRIALAHRRSRSLSRALFCVAALQVLASSSICHAESQSTPSASSDAETTKPRVARRWYGYQIWAADAVSGALFLSAVEDHHNTALFGTSAVTFGLGAPAIHFAHREWAMALGSFGLRVAGPLLGALIGSQGDERSQDDSGSGSGSSTKWTTLGIALGGIASSALDGSVLAYDTQPRTASAYQASSFADAIPQVTVRRRGLSLGCAIPF